MEEIIYFFVRIICFVFLIFKLRSIKKYVDDACYFLYDILCSHKLDEKKDIFVSFVDNDADVIGTTNFVYLDENLGHLVAPSTPLEYNYIGEEEDVDGDEVECNLQLEKMFLLREEQKDLDANAPIVENISRQILSISDLSNMGDVLYNVGNSRNDGNKLLRAAYTLYAIRETDMFTVISSQVQNKEFIGNLIDKFLNEDGTPKEEFIGKKKLVKDNWKIVLCD